MKILFDIFSESWDVMILSGGGKWSQRAARFTTLNAAIAWRADFIQGVQ